MEASQDYFNDIVTNSAASIFVMMSFDLSLVQNNGNVRKNQELMQWGMHEFSERRNQRERDDAEPFPLTKREIPLT